MSETEADRLRVLEQVARGAMTLMFVLVRARVVLAGAVGVYRLCHDLPMALYSDRRGVFRTQTKYFSQEFAILDFITRV